MNTRTYTDECTHTNTLTFTHASIEWDKLYMHKHMDTFIQSQMKARTHTYTRMHTCTKAKRKISCWLKCNVAMLREMLRKYIWAQMRWDAMRKWENGAEFSMFSLSRSHSIAHSPSVFISFYLTTIPLRLRHEPFHTRTDRTERDSFRLFSFLVLIVQQQSTTANQRTNQAANQRTYVRTNERTTKKKFYRE